MPVITITLPGPQGIPGEPGPPGSQGDPGADGAPGTLSVGTVTTGAAGSSASATITGTAPSQVLNLTIPRGDAGSGAADANATTKGLVQLAGDLGGTAASPTVPGLAGKANTSHTHTATDISNSTATGRSVLTATDAAAARTAIGAGTSNLAVGTLVTDAKAGNYQPTAANISDSTAVGRSVLTAVDGPAARTAIGAGTSSLAIGTTGTTAKAGDYQPTAANISDSTATGRSVLTAVDGPAARTAIGAGTSSLAIGTTGTTAKAGDYQPTAANISDSTATGRSVLTAVDAAAARTAIGAGTGSSNLAIGTTSTTAKAGDYQPTAANISDSTATGRSLITAVDAAAARTATGAGTSNLAIGTTGTTACAGNDSRLSDARTPTAHTHVSADVSDATDLATASKIVKRDASGGAYFAYVGATTAPTIPEALTRKDYVDATTKTASQISDSTATGRSLITAVDAAAARTTLGVTADPALGTNFTNGQLGIVAGAQRAAAAANAMYFVQVQIPVATTLTGLRYRKGTGTVAANVIGALYNSAGTRVAVSGTVAAGTTASAQVQLPFSGTYAAAPGLYYMAIIGSSTSADFYGWATAEYLGPATTATQGSFATPTTFTPPANTAAAAAAAIPMMSTY